MKNTASIPGISIFITMGMPKAKPQKLEQEKYESKPEENISLSVLVWN